MSPFCQSSQSIRHALWICTAITVLGAYSISLDHHCKAEELSTANSTTNEEQVFEGTERLDWEGDIADRLVSACDAFLLRKIEEAAKSRSDLWNKPTEPLEGWLDQKRSRLKNMLGAFDPRTPFRAPEVVAHVGQNPEIYSDQSFAVQRVRWPSVGDLHHEGLLFWPKGKLRGYIIAIPDADQSPAELFAHDAKSHTQAAAVRALVKNGFIVVVPELVNRRMEKRNGRANLTSREFLYRSAFELGRHLVGYEVQSTLALVDWFEQERTKNNSQRPSIGVLGYGEGGMLALYSAAIDRRIDFTLVSGYFGPRNTIWSQPIDRNVFGLLKEFGDAELTAMIAPRHLAIEASKAPELTLPSEGGAPAELKTPALADVRAEFVRGQKLSTAIGQTPQMELLEAEGKTAWEWDRIANWLATASAMTASGEKGEKSQRNAKTAFNIPEQFELQVVDSRLEWDAGQHDLIHRIDEHNQDILRGAAAVRAQFVSQRDYSSIAAYEQSNKAYRQIFSEQIVGEHSDALTEFHPRSRKLFETEKFVAYEVVLDVYPDVFAYGILCWPKGMKQGERRPVVVCQHGLEGRPQDIVRGDHEAYHDFAAKLCERGYITFSPQNNYIFQDRFRSLQRKSNAIGTTLFSIMVPQHQQIVNWLKSLPQVDSERIAFYGLSYGGKSAMRIPALVTDYCLSICSADFNDWVWKNASTHSPYSYVWTGEYEIFEFNLGPTFNYAEMASLIAPRPFMVERGHFDGVAPDETVAYEFAKVRHLYAAKLGLSDRCELEFFVGPHTINGKGTFAFLDRHLQWTPK
jgi:dienelactone hydrolase